MKKLLLVAMLLVSTLTFAHERSREEKKEMYVLYAFFGTNIVLLCLKTL